ncbi:MAG: PAS domain S-box protein [Treponemataceae bacterium]
MTDRQLKIIFVEDLPTDTELAEREFKKNGYDFLSMRVDTKEAFLSALNSFNADIVISDYMMPVFDGMTALKMAKEFDPMLPFIVLTGSMNEETAVTCMKAGASDYVIKEHISRLTYAVVEAIERREIQEKSNLQSELLRQSEERYRSFFVGSNAVMLIIDPTDTVIIDANNAAISFYGWSRDELIGKRLSEINTLSPEMLREQIRRSLFLEKNHFQFKHRLADGRILDVEAHSGPILIGGVKYLLSIIHDISERIAAESERDALGTKLSHYLSTSPTVTYSLRLDAGKAKWEWVSENITRMLGYSIEEALKSDWWFMGVYASDRANALKGIAALIKNESHVQEYRFVKKDHSVVWLRDEMRFVKGSDDASEIVGTLTDITEHKRSEESISLKSAALDAADNAVAITDRNGAIEWVNSAFLKLSGYTEKEAMGKNSRDLVKSGKVDAAVYRSLWDTILSGQVWRGELVNKRKTGELFYVEMTITPVLNAAGYIEHFIAVDSDITERIRSNERLEASLREKDVLLREVHHRVKNNMQVISSLLNLSANELADSVFSRTIEAITRRIQAMSIVHEQFYESEELTRIDFPLYLRNLTAALIQDQETDSERPQFIFSSDEVMLNLEQAIPAGLIISEFVSNSLSYAFGESNSSCSISITLHLSKLGDLEIEVRDNGVGLPEGFDPKTAKTLGMQLINILSEQLRGTVSFRVDVGTIATLRFPLVRTD